jgi:hypothetical protein
VLNYDNEASLHQPKKKCPGSTLAGKHEGSYELLRKNYVSFAKVKDTQNADNSIADKRELPNHNNDNNEVAVGTSLRVTTTCPKTDDVTSSQESGINMIRTDDGTISALQFAKGTDCQLGNRETCTG